MKIRYKYPECSAVHEVFEESPHWYIVKHHGNPVPELCNKEFWEPVPEKVWRDVTAEVEAKGNSIIHQYGSVFNHPIGKLTDNDYRLRKVKVYDKKYEVGGIPFRQSMYVEYDAFIIEKLD